MRKFGAFLTGITVGAVLTAVLTPKAGKDLQDDLIKKANELQKKVKEFDIKDVSLTETKDVLKEKIEDSKKMIEEFDWAESKEKVQKKSEEISERLAEIKLQLVEGRQD